MMTFKEAERLENQCAELLAVLIEVRTWIGDGEMSDGLHRAHWTPEYAAIVDRVDAAISKAKGPQS